MTTLVLRGTIISARTITHLRVEAWDAAGLCPDLVDVALTDARGQFELQLDADYLAALLPQKVPEIAFRVFESGRPLAQAQRVIWRIAAQVAQLRIPLAAADEATIARDLPAQAVVRGTVRNGDGTPAANRIVRALDRDLAGAGFANTALGQAASAVDGRYEIHYAMPAAGKLKPDLVVTVEAVARSAGVATLAPAAPNTALPAAVSALLPGAPTVAMVDLSLDGVTASVASEHGALLALVAPRARDLASATPDQLGYLAGTAGVRPERVRQLAQAAQLAKDAGGAVDAEVFYGLLRSGHKGDLAALAADPVEVQRARLERAIASNVIAKTRQPQIDAILGALSSAIVARALPASGATIVSVALANSLAGRDVQTAFVSRWVSRTGSAETFWTELRSDPQLGASAAELETALRLDLLFDGFQPALAELRVSRQAGKAASLRDLARWQDTDWHAFLGRVGTPPGTPGATSTAKAAAYAAKVSTAVRTAFPTEYLRGRAAVAPARLGTKYVSILAAANPALNLAAALPTAPSWGTIAAADQPSARAEWAAFQAEARTFRGTSSRALLDAVVKSGGANPIRAAVNQVLVASAGVDLEHTTIDQYLAANPKALDAIAAPLRPTVLGYLKGVQRMLRIVRRPEAIEPILADGLDSALRIVRLSRAEFVDRHATVLGGATAAHETFSAAFRAATIAQLALTTAAQSMADISPWAVRGGSTSKFARRDYAAVLGVVQEAAGSTNGTATWPTLFEGEAWCNCEDCKSIYGPAAYFVDLLHMIDPDTNHSPADQLFARRPDLKNLSLTCDNTKTPLPYIDVVNEILELYIAAERGYIDPKTQTKYAISTSCDSTGRSAAELRAVPQNVIDEVYDDALAHGVYPFTLPMRRSLAVMRTYLGQLGTTYRDVLAAFGATASDDGITADERLAGETLGLTHRQFELVAGLPTTPAVTLPECYGYAAQDPQWQSKLAVVPELLVRTGITYDDLYALSSTYVLNRPQAIALDTPAQCQIDDTNLLHPAANTWEVLHRFVRLWRATGWSIADLDRTLFAVGAQPDSTVVLGRDAVRRIAAVMRTIDALGQPLAAVLALWSPLDTWGADARYLALFQNRTVARLDDAPVFKLADQTPIQAPTGVIELETATEPMSAHVATILAALRITATDLDAIWNHALATLAFGHAVTTRAQTLLDIRNLTVVYRYTVLAKGLGLRIADLVTILALTGDDPFTAHDPAPTLAFIDRVAAIRASGCTVATLEYLFACYSAPGQAPAPADSVMFDALAKIWAALRGVRHDTAVTDDPDGTLLAARLALIQPPSAVAAIVDALDPAKGSTTVARDQALDNYLAPVLAPAELAAAKAQVTGTADPSDPVDAAARKAANQTAVLAFVSAALRRSLSEAVVISVVAGTLGLADSTTRRLLVDWLPGDATTALDTLLQLAGGGLAHTAFAGPGYTNPAAPDVADSIALQTTAAGTVRGAAWSGFLLPLGDGDHTFVLRTDGACTITIDGHAQAFPPKLDGTHPLLVENTTAPIPLAANRLVTLDVTYDSGTTSGSFALLWRLAAAATATPIAPEYLFATLTELVSPDHGPSFVWTRAYKAALLILGLGLSEAEIAYSESDAAALGGLHLRDVPMTAPAPDAVHAQLARWQELAAFVAVRAALPTSDTALVDVLSAHAPAGADAGWWTTQLCAATGWDPVAVQPLLTGPVADPAARGAQILAQILAGVAGPLDPSGALDLGHRLAALQRCLDLVKRIGIAGDSAPGTRPTLRTWAAAEPDAVAAREVVQAVRAGYSDDTQWYQVAQTLNDTLRQLQRDALIAYIMARIWIDGTPPMDVDSLYEHFLIDVDMCACGTTSRVLQGISTVQLFIQRILLGLEPPISPSRIDPDKWKWNQEYRVWQANREIFLYPENWVDPELRVDKSPFFADLQSQLSQGPLDPENVERAFETYVLALEQVSRLKVCALHWEREGTLTDADSEITNDHIIDTLHVVARTPGANATYFYRTLLGAASGGGGSEWTPWEKIDLDIQSDGDAGDAHMILTTYDRRLYLFWALFTDTPEQKQPGVNQGDSPPPPLTHWDIRLAWATYRNGAWSAKQVSSNSLTSNRFITHAELSLYANALHDLQSQIATLMSTYEKAKKDASDAEIDLWNQLRGMRHSFIQCYVQYLGSIHVAVLLNVLNTYLAVYFFCSCDEYGNVSDGPGSLAELESTLSSYNRSYKAFLNTIYGVVDVWNDSGPQFIVLDPEQHVFAEAYANVLELRNARDAAKKAYDEFAQTKDDFLHGKTELAISSRTRRADYTLWLSTKSNVEVDVVRHDETTNPKRVGRFSLSGDGRSVSATASSGPLDLTHQAPHHSTPSDRSMHHGEGLNAFWIDTSQHAGLDLDGLPNLLGSVQGTSYYDEHWLDHAVSSTSLRPFFVAKGTDVEVALPFVAQVVSDPAVELAVVFGGVGISPRDNRVMKLATTAPRGDARLSSSGNTMRTLAATVDATRNTITGVALAARASSTAGRALMDDAATAIRAQKSFGLEALAMNPIKKAAPSPPYCFEPFHHPFVPSFLKRLERDGVDGLLATAAQNPDGSDHGEHKKHFDTTFAPSTKLVAYPYSSHDVDFRPQGPYAPYNWELFFHAPYLIAARLMQDGRYDDARRWLHYVFNPTTSSTESVPKRFWKLQPFRSNDDTLEASQLMTALATNSPADVAASVNAQIDQWTRYPADPHRIARLRLSAYQKAIVFKYLDNLIAWADSLFTQDTIETINQATQLYVFASQLLGQRPQHVPQDTTSPAFTYAQLRGHLDRMSDMLEEVEALVLPFPGRSAPQAVAYSLLGISHLPLVWQAAAATDDPLMFCVPANTKLLGYYATIDDRLFKIRHCMNIEGVVQQLPLFQPPIDPALLVRAAAMGLDIGSILADLAAPLPFHRYGVLAQKATELCNELKSLSGQLLTALEKQDAESLAILRATQDRALLQAVLEVKKQQVKDAKIGKTAVQRTRDVTQVRVDYYASRKLLSPLEEVQLEGMLVAAGAQLLGGIMSMAAAAAASIPDFDVGPTGMGAHGTAKYGGTAVGNIAGYTGEALSVAAQAAQTGASAAGILAGHTRRQEEWAFQQELATKELAQIDQQLAAADIRIAIANLDVANQQLQIDNSAKIESTLRTKYTNVELYSWMVTQLSTTYYQAYKLAYDLAKRAERCYRYELGIESSSFVQFGYWDSLRKGLLAGEQLALDLKRMDASYLQLDRREYEITRQISLVLQDPQAFALLRQKGACEVDLTEELFDADYPGHYFRRIKNVSLTLPCVAGPYTPINCTLTLLASHVRTSALASAAADSYPERNAPKDARFSHTYGAIQSVATSHGQNDAGLFEVSFQDPRYLPFEGAGAISRWRLELPRDCNAFDPDTLADVVLKLSYTARDGGKPLADAARKSLRARWKTADANDALTPATLLRRLFRVRYEYSDSWVLFRNALATGAAALTLTIDRDRFPYQFRGVPIQIVGVQFLASLAAPVSLLTLTVTPPQGSPSDLVLAPPAPADPSALVLVSGALAPPPVEVATNTVWTIAANAGFPVGAVRDLVVLMTYTASMPPFVQ